MRVCVPDIRGVECYILLVIKHHDSRKSSRYFRDGSDVVYVVGCISLFFVLSVETKGFVVDNITIFCHENLTARSRFGFYGGLAYAVNFKEDL